MSDIKEKMLVELEKITTHAEREFDFNVKEDRDEVNEVCSEFKKLMSEASNDDVGLFVEDPRFLPAHGKLGPRLTVGLHQNVLSITEVANGVRHIRKVQMFHDKVVDRFLAVFKMKPGKDGAGMKPVMPAWMPPSRNR